LLTNTNITLNSDNGAADTILTFGSDSTNETLKFLNNEDRFEFSDDANFTGTVTASGNLVIGGTSVFKGNSSGHLIKATLSPLRREIQFASGSMKIGSGFAQFMVPAFASGWSLTGVQFDVRTAGTTDATKVQLRQLDKGNRQMLSTAVQVDSGEKTSLMAATAYVIDTASDDVHGGQLITVDVSAVSSTAPKDPSILIQLSAP
ncbi:MAG: hypothetical protein AAB489_03530, partial [Patescibacteria group bacterium]